jgi:hypothetical protein
MRLVELIEDLEAIPGPSGVFLSEQQKLGYLLSAIQHEASLQSVYSQLQSEQLRGLVTFDQACRELHFRCEAIRADEYLDSRPGKVLISTERKKKGQEGQPTDKLLCLKKGCVVMIPSYLPLCKVCYLECMAGKTVSIALRDNLGTVTFNSGTQKIDFPSGIPSSRFPKQRIKKKALLASWKGLSSCEDRPSSSGETPSVKVLCFTHRFDSPILSTNENPDPVGDFSSSNADLFSFSEAKQLFNANVAPSGGFSSANHEQFPILSTRLTCLAVSNFDSALFYVDSGAGQCLCSCDEAFMNMSPCEIEIFGVSGSLQIYGIGTALFVVKDHRGDEIILRVHNCLYSQGSFTLISVSQLCGKPGNRVDLSLDSPALHLVSSGPKHRKITVPLYLDDGLFAAGFEPLQVDDPRYEYLPK